MPLSCELLSIWLLLWISHSNRHHFYVLLDVVNCFQFDYFCGYHTAGQATKLTPVVLWIAFNLITFVDITQPRKAWTFATLRCELLSIWLLLWISHSSMVLGFLLIIVVNCFQFDYFCGYHTALFSFTLFPLLLWIAFNLITFVDITQPLTDMEFSICCCELLSIWLLLWISHSYKSLVVLCVYVVNCFQFDYFCGYHTACQLLVCGNISLWIAFNLITFVDITQRKRILLRS